MSQLTRSERIWTVVLTLFLLSPAWFLFAQRPDEVTRGPASEQIYLNVPMPITEARQIDSWSELAAMLTVAGVIMGLVQFLVIRLWIGPEIKRHLELQQGWAIASFPSKNDMAIHLKDDQVMSANISRLVEFQGKDHSRLSQAHLDIELMKQRLEQLEHS